MSKINEPKRVVLPPGPMPYLTHVSKDDIDDGFRKTLSPDKKHKLDMLSIKYLVEDDMSVFIEDNVW